MVKLVISENESGQRLDRFLKKYMQKAPLSMIYRLIRKDVKVNGRREKAEHMLSEGDEITLYMPEDRLIELTGKRSGMGDNTARHSKRQFRIAYEDDEIVIVSKPKGLLVHGDGREKKNMLTNQVQGYLKDKGEFDPASERTFSPSPVNRLDRNTTGLVIFGKNAAALRTFAGYMRERECIEKYYLTLVYGELRDVMILGGRIVRDEDSNTSRIASGEDGRPVETRVRPVACGGGFSLVEAELVTGRTHQIRAHLAEAGFPPAGDAKYGDRRVNEMMKRRFALTTQLLHAWRLVFGDIEGRYAYLSGKETRAELPAEFMRIADGLGFAGALREVTGN